MARTEHARASEFARGWAARAADEDDGSVERHLTHWARARRRGAVKG